MLITKVVIGAVALLFAGTASALPKDEAETLSESATVLTEIRNAPDKGIPESIWAKAECVIVIPDLKKAGFIVGGESGSGAMSCRTRDRWSPPVFMKMTKGSIGLQAGVQSADIVLLVMNRSGLDKLLSDKTTLGADASVAAGPVGRQASAATDAQLTAQMLAYSRAKGLFAGVSLSGGTLRPDKSSNEAAYGATVTAREIVTGTARVTTPVEAGTFLAALHRGDVSATTGQK